MTIGQCHRNNWLIPIIGKTVDNRPILIIGASLVVVLVIVSISCCFPL